MGVFQPGLMIDFACTPVEATTFSGGSEPVLATVTVDAQAPGNTVWFTAHVQWEPGDANVPLTLRIVREDDSIVCSTTDQQGSANSPFTTAFTCCDVVDEEGPHTYRLVALRPSNPDTEIQDGNFVAAVINT